MICAAIGVVLIGGPGTDVRNTLRYVYYAKILRTPMIDGAPRRVVACDDIEREATLVVLVLGQSNAANFAATRSGVAAGVYSFYRNQCYAARDPMLGADGTGGSVWPRLGNMLVAGGFAANVVFANVAVGGTAISQWIPGTENYRRVVQTIRELHESGFEISRVLWHQGESDAALGTTKADYMEQFERILAGLRSVNVEAPVYVSQATWCFGRSSTDIAAAQKTLVDWVHGTRAGPNTDALRAAEYRYDGCHFSDRGVDAAARLWFRALSGGD